MTCKPAPESELMRLSARVPERLTDGGGGTTAVAELPRIAGPIPETACCSCSGNCGAGPTTLGDAMLLSPTLRAETGTVGGGATTAALVAPIARRAETAPTSGGGATTET